MLKTPIEALLANSLNSEGLQYREQVKLGSYVVDFLVNDANGRPSLVVECDGARYHSPEKDAGRDHEIRDCAGLDVLRFSGADLVRDAGRCARLVREKLDALASKAQSAPELDAMQQAAAKASSAATMVYAPAGSGKTRVLTERIIFLIREQQFNPARVCALTFTRDAAAEMRKRVAARISQQQAEQLHISTFHSLAGSLRAARGKDIIDEERRLAVLKASVKKAGMQVPAVEVGNLIGRRKANLIDLEEFRRQCARAASTTKRMESGRLLPIWEQYEEQLSRDRQCDYDDLLVEFVKRAQSDRNWAAHVSRLFDYVLVDEMQDNNRAQDEILRLLVSSHGRFMLVADDDQAIYGFRGAAPELLREKEAALTPRDSVHVLETNYRSHPQIVSLAGGFIAGSVDRRLKPVRAERNDSGDAVSWVVADNPVEEARRIAENCKGLTTDSVRSSDIADPQSSDIAILLRSNYQADLIAFELSNVGVPYLNFSNDSILKKRAVKVLLAYMRVLSGAGAWTDWRTALSTPNRYIPRELWERLEHESLPLEALETFIAELPSDEQWKGDNWQVDIETFRSLGEGGDNAPAECIRRIRDAFSLDKAFDELIDGEVVVSGKEHLDYLQAMASAFGSVSAFLDYCAALEGRGTDRGGQGRVKLMTIHRSKGLEFSVVFLAGLTDRQFPHWRGNPAEERRLCYVAMTRARDQLYLCRSRELPSEFCGALERALKTPHVQLLADGQTIPELGYRIGADVVAPGTGKAVIRAFSNLHGILLEAESGTRSWLDAEDDLELEPFIHLRSVGEAVPGHKLKIGDEVGHPRLGRGVIAEFRTDKGFKLHFDDESVAKFISREDSGWVSERDARNMQVFVQQASLGDSIPGLQYRIGDRVSHRVLGQGCLVEYRSDKGVLIDFFVQKRWLDVGLAKKTLRRISGQ
jgi:DNA helicase-2/ATP-dependent DNA helicase PcrA